ncbi:lytic transglycosylase domain-containing protein [Bacillus solitudinis]|uniref:lytic transglycosylase domain-containing protein n=1 Tax=Bacillus solitudinis TaxID=2014074 RepID=UPI000C247B24|nr:lytic transglycosylase domain-containing protein [Bacillus solitudinis]
MRKKRIRFLLLGILIIASLIIIEEQDKIRQITYIATLGKHSIPEQYYPIYKKAAEEFDIPWELLASVHRVETVFSTMDPLISPVGAVGHFQFMPRTWIGWTHPGSDLGTIDEDVDLTDILLIETHNGYGLDASGNGKADPFDVTDSAFAAAKYLADHGAKQGDYKKALFAYNQSDEYVNEVLLYYESYLEHYELIDLR